MSQIGTVHFHRYLYLYGCFLLWYQACTPVTIDLSDIDPLNTTRPSGSQGGMVHGVDSYTLTATLTRPPAEKDLFVGYDVVLDTRPEYGQEFWDYYKNCEDIDDCPSTVQTGCFCESSTPSHQPDTFHIVIKLYADKFKAGHFLRVRWIRTDSFARGDHAVSNTTVTLPFVICDPTRSTVESDGKYHELSENKTTRVMTKSFSSEVTFNLEELCGDFELKIERDGQVVSQVTNSFEISTVVSKDLFGKTFVLSFSESVEYGCGRAGVYNVSFVKSAVPSHVTEGCPLFPCTTLKLIVVLVVGGFMAGIIAHCVKDVKRGVVAWAQSSQWNALCFVVFCFLGVGIGFTLGVLCAWSFYPHEQPKQPRSSITYPTSHPSIRRNHPPGLSTPHLTEDNDPSIPSIPPTPTTLLEEEELKSPNKGPSKSVSEATATSPSEDRKAVEQEEDKIE